MSENIIDLSDLTDEQRSVVMNQIDNFKKENSKTLLDKAAEDYCNNIKLNNGIAGPADAKAFKEGAMWVVTIWKQIRNPEHSIATVSNFDDFIRRL